MQASVEISTFPKTGLQGFEQNTPIGNPLADELVEKKSKAPWVIGIILLLLGFLFICFHLNKNNSGVPQGTRTDSHDGTTYKAVVKGTMTDSRDGKTYKTVKIGRQTWMAENLNFRTNDSWCNGNKESNCSKYGRLYTWNAAIKACPSGWHLPSKVEFETLFTAVGGESTAGKMLKSQSGWYDNGNGNGNGIDAYGFSALTVGVRNSDGNFRGGDGDVADGFGADFWSASLYMGAHPYKMFLSCFNESASLPAGSKDEGFSVRCLKD